MALQTIRPKKGDFVPGHQAMAFLGGDLPCVRGRITYASKSGHCVEFEVNRVLEVMGFPRRSCWTWRKSVGAYQQRGWPTRNGQGLAIIKSPA